MASLSQRRCFRFFEKNYLRIFFNYDFVGTEPKEAPYETTGNSAEFQKSIALKFNTALHLILLFSFLGLASIRNSAV
jgi:hypothetical protein